MKQVMLWGMLASQLACNINFEKRDLPAPRFDAGPVFNKAISLRATGGEEAVVDDPFAAMDRDVVQPETETATLQLVSLGGVVRSSVPISKMGGGWNISSSGSDFMVLHHDETKSSTTPNVMIYGYYDSQASMNKTLTSRRFISVIDPGMEQSGVWEMSPYIGSVLSSLSLENPMDVSSLSSLTNAFQPSLGLGIGYLSNPNTFTGWKWVGRNQYDVYIRLGKTKGKFMPVQDALKSELSSFRFSGLEKTAEDLMNLQNIHKELYAQSGVSAEMIFGSLGYNDQTVYIAIMCVTQPTCGVSDELIDFLDNIQPIQEGDVFGTSIYSSPSELAQAFSIPIFGSTEETFKDAEKMVLDELTALKNTDANGILSQLTGVNASLDDVLQNGEALLENLDGVIPTEGEGQGGEGVPAGEGVEDANTGDSGY